MTSPRPTGVPTRGPDPHGRVDLDPVDWARFRELAHVMLDDAITYLRTVGERPAWRSPDPESRAKLSAPVPREGRELADVYSDFRRAILPYPTGNIHPRFWGWVMGNGTPVGVLAEMLTATMNSHVSGYDQAASLVEHQVIRWLAELLDYPTGASGVLVSGATVANLVGVSVARNHSTGQRVRTAGVDPAVQGRMTVYGSTATHGWAQRACDLLGLGESGFRKIAIDAHHRVRIDELAHRIRADRAAGLAPICIVGNAGTVTCGATDDLNALADLAESENLWFHVDGAFGALAKLSPRHRHICDGLERADSIAFDLHKWGYVQYEVGVVLVRDGAAHEESFSFSSSYLESFRGGIAVKPTEFASRGVQLSRGFRALKVWMQLEALGTDRIGAVIAQNIDDVQDLRARIERESELEQLGPAPMNVVCFRYRVDGLGEEQLDALNTEILVRVQESGVAVPSNARVDGKFATRVANTNHRSRPEDFALLVDTVLELGRQLAPRFTSRR